MAPPLVERALALTEELGFERSCTELPPEGPFDLVFFDAAKQDRPQEDGELVVSLLAPGGIAVLDDLTPGRPGPDPVREFWSGRRDLTAIEVLTAPEKATILAVRR